MSGKDTSSGLGSSVVSTLEKVSTQSSRSLRISTVIFIFLALAVATIASVVIVQSFDTRGVAVAIAVVGGSVAVFGIAISGRLITDAVITAARAAREAQKDDGPGHNDTGNPGPTT